MSEQQEQQCSKCDSALDTEGYPRWCRKCRAKYRREYNEIRETLDETRSFSAGVEAMRNFLAERFSVYTIQSFNGPEIAHIIRSAQAPANPQ